jgi:hypothetical protein
MTLPAALRVAASPIAGAHVAAWTWTQARRLPEALSRRGIDAIATIEPSPPAAAVHRSTVSAVLRLAGTTCLVRSAVLQRWDADHGRPRPLVVGVAREHEGGFEAHAWLEGESEGDGDGLGFVEVHRRPAVTPAGRSPRSGRS